MGAIVDEIWLSGFVQKKTVNNETTLKVDEKQHCDIWRLAT